MMYSGLLFRHRLHRSFFGAVGILFLFLVVVPVTVIQAETIPVFNSWRNQPPPAGNPMQVQYLLDGTYYEETIEVMVFHLQQWENRNLEEYSL